MMASDGPSPNFSRCFTPLSMALIVRNYDAAQALIDSGATISKEAAEKLTKSAQDDKAKALIKKATK